MENIVGGVVCATGGTLGEKNWNTFLILCLIAYVLKTNNKMMKGVLRIPCLSKRYHDMIRDEHLPEFESLEYVFNNYY